jgi:hypothetical protein
MEPVVGAQLLIFSHENFATSWRREVPHRKKLVAEY